MRNGFLNDRWDLFFLYLDGRLSFRFSRDLLFVYHSRHFLWLTVLDYWFNSFLVFLYILVLCWVYIWTYQIFDFYLFRDSLLLELSLQVGPNICNSLAIEVVRRRQRDNQELVTALKVCGRLFSQTQEDNLNLDCFTWSNNCGVWSHAVKLWGCGLDLKCNGLV
ncbi:hypothetical protein AWRI1631_51850 [Saccharomyces cerevisiae AWRI1631]|uniref:Uncharacterized protein n=1 Tax=Saccharomyces cerevisiae (strain AWRI1631) TaxID=545124 RepID=B5VHP7_YEAS6|nr:hypothetical protein AWRI1631_51850 [Saccharomyces cerevisiae AWRI1631]